MNFSIRILYSLVALLVMLVNSLSLAHAFFRVWQKSAQAKSAALRLLVTRNTYSKGIPSVMYRTRAIIGRS